MKQRPAGLFAALILLASTPSAFAQSALAQAAPAAAPSKPSPAAQAEIDRILAADMEGYLVSARQNFDSARTVVHAIAIGVDDIAAGNPNAAAATIATLPARRKTTVTDLLDMWIALARDDKPEALQRAALAKARLSKTLGLLAPALIEESSGDLARAADAYANAIDQLDVSPLPDSPSGRDAAERFIEAPRTAQVIYRAAQVNHRLGRKDEAVKYYLLSGQFAPNSPDIEANLARAESGAAPFEPALTMRSGLGRWLLMLSFQYQRDAAERAAARGADAAATADPLAALDGALIAQLGLRLDPGADDWRVAAAAELAERDAFVGAEKLARAVRDESPYAAEAKLVLARAAVGRNRDAEAATVLAAAMKLGAGRSGILLEAGRNLAVIGRYDESRQALGAAIESAGNSPDKAAAYLARAGANYQAGRLVESAQDARDAMATQQSDDVRLSAAGYLAATPDGWYEAVRIGRGLLLTRPHNVDTMNTLGYALIQREQGLDEGFKLLRQAVDIDPAYYPVVDSLGWAYYQYGDFENALKFVAQANELSLSGNAEVLDHLGDIYWRINRQKDARETWKKALTVRPEALRRVELEQKLAKGPAMPAPVKREEPIVDSPGRRAAPSKI
jgi:tetratricopeptide (TPR) repeat protein